MSITTDNFSQPMPATLYVKVGDSEPRPATEQDLAKFGYVKAGDFFEKATSQEKASQPTPPRTDCFGDSSQQKTQNPGAESGSFGGLGSLLGGAGGFAMLLPGLLAGNMPDDVLESLPEELQAIIRSMRGDDENDNPTRRRAGF